MGRKKELHDRPEAREEELSRTRIEGRQLLEELRLAQRTHSLSDMVRVTYCRGGSKRARAHLSMHAGHAFPAAKKRVQALREQRKGVARARALVYAVEQEIAARRAARKDKWPKTSGLELRDFQKKTALVALKRQYDRAYQQLRQLRRTGQQLQAAARLTAQRLLKEAWMILLELPTRRDKSEAAIPLGN